MSKISKFGLIILALLCTVSCTGMAATLTQSITYQGWLTDAGGNPLSGTHSITFKLYEGSSGGTALATFTNSSVQCTNGTFTTPVTLDSSFFDGRALWLGISVGADPEMTPRQEIRPVPYALGLRPGAKIKGDVSGYVLNITNSGLGWYKHGLDVETVGQNSNAIYAHTTGPGSNAVVGKTEADGPAAIAGLTTGVNSPGLYGYTTNTSAHGVWAKTEGSGARGVYGESLLDVGVYGKGKEGAYFTTNQQGIALNDGFAGVNVSTKYKYNPGISVNTTDDYSFGIIAETDGFYSMGVVGETHGDGSHGVAATTTGPNSHGVYSMTWHWVSHGVYAKAYGPYSYGMYADSSDSDGIYATTWNASRYGIYTPNRLYAGGGVFPASDVAEYMPVTENVTPGTVLVIGDDGKLQVTSRTYDTRVAGIVSTSPAVSLGGKDTGNPGDAPIAVAGRVPCKVDASYGAIHPGDLLTTSNNPGYAMKATDPKIGTILGKAMGTLETGTGVIEVLVTLQ